MSVIDRYVSRCVRVVGDLLSWQWRTASSSHHAVRSTWLSTDNSTWVSYSTTTLV